VRLVERAPGASLGAFAVWALLCAAALGGCTPLGVAGEARREPVAGGERAEGAPERRTADAVERGGEAPAAPEAAEWGSLRDEPIRVGLVQRGRAAVVSSRGGACTLKVYSGAAQSFSAVAGEAWSFDASAGGVSARSSGGASFELEEGTVRVRPGASTLLLVDGVAYRGEIEVYPAGAGSLSVVNVIGMESYLRGVLPGEIGRRPESDIEAVKAQAVAARTYAAASSGSRAGGDFDVLPTTADQLYEGADAEDAVCDRAILETAGLVLAYQGAPAVTYFHSTCGGRTEARHEAWELPELPYLGPVWDTEGGGDRLDGSWCRGAPSFEWTESWTGEEIDRLASEVLPDVASTPVEGPVGRVRGLEVASRTGSGRVRWLEVRTEGGVYRVLADRVRRFLLRPDTGGILRSSWFDLDVETTGDGIARVAARGRGNGHGVGMCQHGAIAMARAGRSYDEILAHYYPGTEFARLSDVW
jgi:stage II sporulation protein D